MGKIAKLFLICTLLLVGESFADLPYALKFSCSKSTDDVYTCNIEQLQSSKPTANTYTTWGSFLQAFQTEIESKLDISKNPSAKTDYSGFVIRFNSNIDFGGYQKTGDVITCRDATFAPMNFGPLAFQPTIDGNGKTIKNFCYITENINASFFGDLQNSKVQNITFDMAYVKATVTSGTNFDAAVVAYRVANVSFKNVTVSNSLVYGWQTATLAVYSGASSSDRDNPAVALSKIKIQNVTLGITKDVIAGLSTVGSLENLQSASGGVIANIGGYPVMDSIEVSKLNVPDAISEVYKSVSGYEYVGDRYVGGVAGRFEPSAVDDGFTLGRISVSADLSGLWVGGLFGRAYIDNHALYGSSYFKLANAKVTLNSAVHSGGNNKARFFGGLVGELHWLRGQISLSNDTVDVSANWHRETDYLNSKACMGGLVGYVSGEEDDSPVDIYAENNVVTAEMKTSAGVVYAGGVLGQVSFVPGPNTNASGNVLVKKTSVKAKETNLIMTTAETVNMVCAGYLVGNAVTRGGNINILQNHAEGNIYIANSGVVAAGALGAEIGLGWFSSIDVSNNSSIGDLFAKTIVGKDFAYRIYRGYVAGTLVSENSATTVSVRDNFHYGSMDMSVIDAVDSLKIAGQGKKKSDWRDKCSDGWNICFNYRNELKGDSALSVSGVLSKDGSGKIIVNTKNGDYCYNGIIDADVMKSRLFTYVLNATQTSNAAPATWENEPDQFPKISNDRTAFRLAISLADADYKELTDNDKILLKDYLPVNQCEAKKCSLYVYTENDAYLIPGFKSNYVDTLDAGLRVLNGAGQQYDFSQNFICDVNVKGLTDREINVVYKVRGEDSWVPMDELHFVTPKVEKVRLFSGKEVVPVAYLNYKDSDGKMTGYELDLNDFILRCKEDSENSCIDYHHESMDTHLLNFSHILKEIRAEIDGKYKDEIELEYKLIDRSSGYGYWPYTDIALIGSDTAISAGIKLTTFAYNGEKSLVENNSYNFPATSSILVKEKVDMASNYGISVAERGYLLEKWNVDFWLGYKEAFNDAKGCYTEGEKPAKCSNALVYGDATKNYLESELKIEGQLNGIATSGSKLAKWSTVLNSDDKLNLDSMIQAMSVIVPEGILRTPMFIAVNPKLSAIQYTVNFDVDADGKTVFLTDEFVIKDSYSRENDETAKLPEGLLATDACFTGWIENAENPVLTPSLKMDGTLLEVANPKDAGAFDLYGAWDAGCTVEKAKVLLKVTDKSGAEGNYGTVMLSQSYRNPGKEKVILKHDFVDGRLEVPTSAEPMTLHVTSTQTNKDYDLAQLTLKAPNGNVMPISLTPGDTSFKLEPRVGESYTLYAMFAGYIDVDVKVNRDNAVYGYASDKKTLHVVERGTTYLPKWVYTPAECVLGWSVSPDGVDYDRDSIASDDLTAKVTSEKAVYAVWGDADACVANADYRRLKLETEHGTVEIIEVNTVDGSEIKHSFAGNSTILLPQDYARSKWVVRGVPQKGYKLDSIVIDGRIKLADGDELADTIQGYLPMRAYFSPVPKQVESPNGIIKSNQHQVVLSGTRNGNAMLLPIDWDVEQGYVAELHVRLVDSLGVAVASLDTNVTGVGSRNWVVYPLLPGTYYARGTINSSSIESVPLVTEPFTVLPEIAVASNTWRMVSLSDVDQSAIMWDADPAFYYWDESAEYGVVWKYQRYNGGAVKAQQGIWYNSLEGRALPLRRDVATGSNVQGAPQIVWEVNAGWNMVANPYGWRVVLPENVLSTFEMCKWTAESGFEPVHSLEPYEAVWLRSDTKTPIGFAAEPSFDNPVNVAALQKAALAKATRESWALQAVLSDAKGHRDSWNVLGVGAAEERLEPPAGMGDFVNLSVVEGKKALLKSIKGAEDDRHEWNLALSATTDRVGYLKFEGVKALNEMGLKVYVTIDGKTTEMGAGDSLKVLLKAAGSMATVQVTSSAVTTVASKIENLRFARVPGALQVGFDVSSDLAGAGYRVQLVDFKGRVAATYSAKSTAGHNTLALTVPKPGLYLLRVTLGRHHAVRKVAISR